MAMQTLRGVVGLVLVVIVAVGCATMQQSGSPLPAERDNYCQDEAIRWVKRRLGEDTTIVASWIDKSGVQEKAVTGWRVLVWTDRCDGYFTMDFGFRTVPECTRPQYGERSAMMMMAGAAGDCRRLVPEMDHRHWPLHRTP
jgi:hypothetical protein